MHADHPNYLVHVTHCCPGHCKYLNDDCPVALGQVPPQYECEDCTCATFHPELRFDRWWGALSPQDKQQIHEARHLLADQEPVAQAATRYVVLERAQGLHAVREREHKLGIAASERSGEIRAATALPLERAQEVQRALAAQIPGSVWELELAASPCPHCGREADNADGDFAYSMNREYTRWRAGCNMHDFGCGYEVFGATRLEALQKWNSAVKHEGPADELIGGAA